MRKPTAALICILLLVLQHAAAQRHSILIELEKGQTLAKKCINCHGTNTAVLADPLG